MPEPRSLFAGSLPEVISNTHNLYEGNLEAYFKILFNYAQNLRYPYHNFRHMTHVVYQCYQACEFYKDQLDPKSMRSLLVAAIFHDFDHSGRFGNDDLNIQAATRAFWHHVLPDEDIPLVEYLIRVTEFPPQIVLSIAGSEEQRLCGGIIRDADLSQAFSVAWIQQVIFGLAAEWGKTPLEVLKMQESFLQNMKLNTEWAKTAFPDNELQAKISEARALLKILEP